MSSYVLIRFEADWAGEPDPEGDPRATMIGVIGVVDEAQPIAVIDERPYQAEIDELEMLFATVMLPKYHATVTQPAPPVAVVKETGNSPVAVIDESRYGAVVTTPGKPIAKVDEWPS